MFSGGVPRPPAHGPLRWPRSLRQFGPHPATPRPDRRPQARRLKAHREQPPGDGSKQAAELGAEDREHNFDRAERAEREIRLAQPTLEALHRHVMLFHGRQRNA